MKILLTAFEPFNHLNINISKLLIEKYTNNDSHQIVKHIIPVAYYDSFKEIQKVIFTSQPDLVIMCGQAQERHKISIEIRAKNIIDSNVADCNGLIINNTPIIENSKEYIYTPLDTVPLLSELLTQNIPTELSNNAGGYICNYLYYNVLRSYPNIPSIFIHFPINQEFSSLYQNNPSLITLANGLSIIIDYLSRK